MENLELFGRMLMKKVRDKTIESAYSVVDGTAKAHLYIQCYKSIENCSDEQKETIKKMMMIMIDNCLFNFMDMLDQNPKTFEIIVHGEDKQSSLHAEEDELHHAVFDWFDYYSDFDYNYDNIAKKQ